MTPALLALALALGAGSALLVPPWPLSRDGDLVGVRGDAALEVEGGRAERVAPALWRVVPDDGAATVALRAGAARAEVAVEPPPAEIAVAASPAAAVKGRDRSVALELVVRRPDGTPDPDAPAPVVAASVGRVGALRPAGPGRFAATYALPDTLQPEVAVLIALAPRCPLCATPSAVGYAIVPLSAAIDLPGRSEAHARVDLRIGGRPFGPVTADGAGRFRVPIVVPPGERFADARIVDTTGNVRRTRIDLHLPEVDQLACAAWPPVVPADGRASAEAWCVASDVAGAAAPGARLALSARRGVVAPLAPFQGALQRARYRAPLGAGGGEDVLSAAFPAAGAASSDTLRVGLAPGPPTAIDVQLAEPVPAGAAVAGSATARDAAGDALGPALSPAGATTGFVAAGRFVARDRVGDGVQPEEVAFALAPGADAAALSLRRERGTWIAEARTVDARPAAGVAIRFGSGAAATTDARGEARTPARGPAETAEAAGGARAAGWEGIAPPRSPIAIGRAVTVALRPASPVDVVARVEGGAVRWRVLGPDGAPLPGRAVVVRGAGVALGPAVPDGDGGRAPVLGGRGGVAVVDEATGVAAIVEVR